MVEFPVSGIETYWWLPVLASFSISVFTSTAGLSGAFLLLPFQMNVLGFVSPGVTPTNLLFNVVAIPGGVIRYYREGRLVWPLVVVVLAGTIPGVLIGVLIRLRFLPDPKSFKLFVGLVLLYIGYRLILRIFTPQKVQNSTRETGTDFLARSIEMDLKTIVFEFDRKRYQLSTFGLALLSLVVGGIGGIYGIGGGAIMAPFLVTMFRLPVYIVAGAALASTFVTSIFGVVFYVVLTPFIVKTGMAAQPDWLLGALLGCGGAAGIYLGARVQRFFPERWILLVLLVCIWFVAGKYVLGYWF